MRRHHAILVGVVGAGLPAAVGGLLAFDVLRVAFAPCPGDALEAIWRGCVAGAPPTGVTSVIALLLAFAAGPPLVLAFAAAGGVVFRWRRVLLGCAVAAVLLAALWTFESAASGAAFMLSAGTLLLAARWLGGSRWNDRPAQVVGAISIPVGLFITALVYAGESWAAALGGGNFLLAAIVLVTCAFPPLVAWWPLSPDRRLEIDVV